MKYILIACAGLLLLSLAKLPIGYYTVLRIAVTIGAIAVILDEKNKGITFWVFLFAVIGIIFNPVIPVYLGGKNIWLPIDVASAIAFSIKAYDVHRNEADAKLKD